MNKLGAMRFLISIVAFFLLMVQAVIGIMMFVDGSDNMKRQAMVGQPAEAGTVGEEPSSDSAAETVPETSGNMGTPPQGLGNRGGKQGEMPNGGGFERGNLLAGKYTGFYQGSGGLVASIIFLLIGGAGIITSIVSRKTEV
ncbi:hypothetical protein ACQKGI_16930 [Peribacillus muralis]|uniref:hypothetical protein n=1 Tax=Peribacillus muralis TaxID=264697 RepID=UPI00382E5E82